MTLRSLILSLILLVSLCLTAYAQPDLVKRVPQAAGQQQPSAQPSVSASPSASAPATVAQPSASVINTAPQANSNQTASGSAPAASGNPVAGLPTTGSFGVTVYPGSASFIQPTGSKSVSPLYRIDPKENVTFIWTYSDLKVRPVNITLAAVNPQSATYTIAQLDGAATSAVWHLSDVPADQPLFNGLYQIQLYDQRGPTAHPEPGYLSPNTRLTIAFYSPESYRPLSGSNYCPTCFYDAARRLPGDFGAMGIAFAVACFSSAMFIYGLFH